MRPNRRPATPQAPLYFRRGTITQDDADARYVALGTPVIFSADTTAARPASPVVGQCYFDTDLSMPIWFNGTDWVGATGAAA